MNIQNYSIVVGGYIVQGNITILNKLKRTDSITGLDVWYKTVIKSCTYSRTKISNVNGQVVSMGTQFTILIPFTNKYVPYHKWKDLENKDTKFTLSNQDIIILGEIKEKEITPNNIVSIKNKYSPNACEIRNIEEVENKFDTRYQFRVNGI